MGLIPSPGRAGLGGRRRTPGLGRRRNLLARPLSAGADKAQARKDLAGKRAQHRRNLARKRRRRNERPRQPLRLETLSCRARVRIAISMSTDVWSEAWEATQPPWPLLTSLNTVTFSASPRSRVSRM